MRFVVQLLFISIAGFLLELFLPWWSIAIAAFLGGLMVTSNANFGAGFIGIAALWSIKALLIDFAAATLLSEKVAAIFQLPNKVVLIMIMCLLGGFVGGFAALSGSLLKKRRRLRYY